jgi:hypothetical protein
MWLMSGHMAAELPLVVRKTKLSSGLYGPRWLITSMSDLTLGRFRLLTGMMTLMCDVLWVKTVRFWGFGKTKVYRFIFANF